MGGIASPEGRWLAMTWEVGRDCFAGSTLARNDRGGGEGLLRKVRSQ